MPAAVWYIAALCLWWLVSTIGCGQISSCLPVVLFFYSPFWIPIVTYLAGAEWASRRFVAKWPLASFAALIVVGIALLLFVLKSRNPLLFANAEASMTMIGMILKPTAATVALFIVKVLYERTGKVPSSAR